MNFYTAYGLTIESLMPLPEFIPAERGQDISIWLDEPRTPETGDTPWRFEYGPNRAVLALEGVGEFYVQNGNYIHIVPAPNADDRVLQLYVAGTLMGLLLDQRGLLVLHGSCVEVAGTAVAFIGASGAGKSSIAAAMAARGHTIVADDVTAVDLHVEPFVATPAFPQLKLSPTTAQSLGYSQDMFIRLQDAEEKQGIRCEAAFTTSHTPLACIYTLDFADHITITSPRPQRALLELITHSYPSKLLANGGAPHFAKCTSLAAAVPIFHLERPRTLEALSPIAYQVETHLLHEVQIYNLCHA